MHVWCAGISRGYEAALCRLECLCTRCLPAEGWAPLRLPPCSRHLDTKAMVWAVLGAMHGWRVLQKPDSLAYAGAVAAMTALGCLHQGRLQCAG